MTNYSGRVYPNGEFTVGVAPRKLRPQDILPVNSVSSSDVDARVELLHEFGPELAQQVLSPGSPLGLSNVPISATRAKKGLKGMTSYGRRMVRNACYLLEERYGSGRCGFGTFTLPSLIFPDWAAVCHDWAKLVNNFIKRVKRRLATRTENPYICYVTEFQTKRYEKEGRAYPHLHICYPARPEFNYNWYISASELRDIWREVIQSRCLCRYDFAASVDCVVVKKSIGAYLSKYLSKGAGDVARFIQAGLPLGCVGHWWGVSGAVRAAIKARTRTSPAIARHLWGAAAGLRERGVIKWLYYISIQTNLTGQRIIGMCGLLDSPYIKWLNKTYPIVRVEWTEQNATG